jgi:LmbE family N-acetylglucosaminyl deacetylase
MMPLFPMTGRHVLVTAHPDDETISASAVLSFAAHVELVQLTTGTDVPDIATARRAERAAALHAGGWPVRVRDGWVNGRAAMRHLPELLALVDEAITGADVVWTHPYEGGHLDHDTAAWLVQTVCASRLRAPVRMEFASYHSGGQPKDTFGDFWPDADSPTWIIRLPPALLERKRAAIAAYTSQASILRKFLSIGSECYRMAPVYDFTQPPPPPMVRWDRRGYQPSCAVWRQAVAEATGGRR